MKLSRKDATEYGRVGVKAFNYSLPTVEGGTSVIYAELTGVHGERTIGAHSRIYYIISGEGEFVINGKTITVLPEDVIVIPPHATYNYWPTKSPLKCLLMMELLDISKLPK